MALSSASRRPFLLITKTLGSSPDGDLAAGERFAQRSVQFFQQAVRVAPERQEYRDLCAVLAGCSLANIQDRPLPANRLPGRADPWKNQPVPPRPNLSQSKTLTKTEIEVDRSELFSNDESATIDQARIEDLKPVASIAEAI